MKYQVWYMKPEFFGDGILGARLPDSKNLSATHTHLKDVEANGVDAVYQAMQGEVWSPNGEARELIQSKGLQHTSMSVGDVIVDDVGNAHVVASIGFKAIGGTPPSWKRRAIASTRGTQLGAILCAVLGEKISGPHFVGKASITSDRFLICNFVDRNGDGHMGAFVGSANDLVSNTRGLADHLKLADAERKELFDAVRGWISLDYTNGVALKELEVRR